MALTNDAIFGAFQGQTLGANMMNPNAQSETDWNAVLSGGIVGAAQGAIQQMIGGAYASGQLQTPQAQAVQRQQQQQQTMMTVLLVAAVAYLVMK